MSSFKGGELQFANVDNSHHYANRIQSFVLIAALVIAIGACSQETSPLASPEEKRRGSATGPSNLQPSGNCSSTNYVCTGESIQKAASSLPEGATITIAGGTHKRQSVVPRNGQTFVGEPGAVLDGEKTARVAFSGDADNVTISNLVVTRYAPELRDGTVQADRTTGWTLVDVEVSYSRGEYTHSKCIGGCGGMGIKMGHRMTIRRSYIHHNDQYGIGGGGDGSLIEDTEIAFNNDRGNIKGALSSGTKFNNTDGLVLRGNHIHDNKENGLWLDIDNVNFVIENNVVEDNTGSGIFIEVSLGGAIRNNLVRRNGPLQGGSCGMMYCSGILVAHTPNVEVRGNTVEYNYRGIGGIQQNRGKAAWILKNLSVRDNVIRGNKDRQAGIAKGNDDWDPYAPGANNEFDFNSYSIPAGQASPFKWKGGTATIAKWKGFGHDLNGDFN